MNSPDGNRVSSLWGVLFFSAFGAGNARLYLILLILAAMTLWPATVTHGEAAQQGVDCAIHTGPCSKDYQGGKITLDIEPKPVKAMQDLTFTVTLVGEKATALPYIDLGMPGMAMGPNRVLLEMVGEGVCQGTGVIVRCPSGRRTWKATVTVPGHGSVEFVFDVIY